MVSTYRICFLGARSLGTIFLRYQEQEQLHFLLVLLHRCLKVKNGSFRGCCELLKVVVAARNDMGSRKLSKFRATKPHRSLGANIMRPEKPCNWYGLSAQGQRGINYLKFIPRQTSSVIYVMVKRWQYNLTFLSATQWNLTLDVPHWDTKQLTIHCRVVAITAYWLMTEFRIVLLADPVRYLRSKHTAHFTRCTIWLANSSELTLTGNRTFVEI